MQQYNMTWRLQVVPSQQVARAGAEDETVDGLRYKLSNPLTFPSRLSVAEYCTAECANASSTTYQLDAVLLQQGSSNCGHYTILQRVAHNLFLLRDDDKLPEEVSQEHVLANFQREACGLLYTLLPR